MAGRPRPLAAYERRAAVRAARHRELVPVLAAELFDGSRLAEFVVAMALMRGCRTRRMVREYAAQRYPDTEGRVA